MLKRKLQLTQQIKNLKKRRQDAYKNKDYDETNRISWKIADIDYELDILDEMQKSND